MKTNPHDLASNLTKREHFAALALQGLISDPSLTCGVELFTQIAVKAADALIKELNATPNND